MGHRVVQWNTGNMGRHGLCLIARHPELELVGLWVHDPAKVGRDASELAGIGPVGVAATRDADALSELGADCVCYTANDLLPLVLTGTCEYVDSLRVVEIVNYATYAQPEVLFHTMGFGRPLDATPLLLTPGVLGFAWGGVLRSIAAGSVDTAGRIVNAIPAVCEAPAGLLSVHDLPLIGGRGLMR